MMEIAHRRRDFHNPEDPIYRKLGYSLNNRNVLRTNKLLSIIKPYDHSDYRGNSYEAIQTKSKKILDKVCDKDSAFFNKSGENNDGTGFKGMSHHKIVRLQGKQIEEAAKQNNYTVNYDGKEYEY